MYFVNALLRGENSSTIRSIKTNKTIKITHKMLHKIAKLKLVKRQDKEYHKTANSKKKSMHLTFLECSRIIISSLKTEYVHNVHNKRTKVVSIQKRSTSVIYLLDQYPPRPPPRYGGPPRIIGLPLGAPRLANPPGVTARIGVPWVEGAPRPFGAPRV